MAEGSIRGLAKAHVGASRCSNPGTCLRVRHGVDAVALSAMGSERSPPVGEGTGGAAGEDPGGGGDVEQEARVGARGDGVGGSGVGLPVEVAGRDADPGVTFPPSTPWSPSLGLRHLRGEISLSRRTQAWNLTPTETSNDRCEDP